MTPPVTLLVLDVHGVVLNRPFMPFLAELAQLTGQTPGAVHARWRDELHDPAWLGAVSDETLWSRLVDAPTNADSWGDRLERRYAPLEAARHLETWSEYVPIWFLSNHRADWLRPRLARLDMLQHADRLLVSDEIGAMKPDVRVFDEILTAVRVPSHVLFVDDQRRNIEAARRVGLTTVLADEEGQWLTTVDRIIHRSRRAAAQ